MWARPSAHKKEPMPHNFQFVSQKRRQSTIKNSFLNENFKICQNLVKKMNNFIKTAYFSYYIEL